MECVINELKRLYSKKIETLESHKTKVAELKCELAEYDDEVSELESELADIDEALYLIRLYAKLPPTDDNSGNNEPINKVHS